MSDAKEAPHVRPTAIDSAAQSDYRWRASSTVAPIAVLAIAAAALWPFLRVFRIFGDDFALVLNSSVPYFNVSDWPMWFTQGYSEYFRNYPGWPAPGTVYVRPMMNVVFYLGSLAVPYVGEVAYLFVNYAALGLTVYLVVRLLRRFTSVGPWVAALLAISAGLSPVWYSALFTPSFGSNVLALLFSAAAIYALGPPEKPIGAARVALSATLQVLAVASHETAAVVTAVCLVLVLGLSGERPRARVLWPLGIPPLFLLAERLALTAPRGVGQFGVAGPLLVSYLKRVAIAPVVPFDSVRMIFAERPATLPGAIPLILATAANLAVLVAIIVGLRRHADRVSVTLAIATGVSLLPAVVVGAEPRFMGIPMILAMLLAFRVTRARVGVLALVTLLLCAQGALFVEGVVSQREYAPAFASRAGQLSDATRAGIRADRPAAVVLVNDSVGTYGSMAMLKLAAWPREDIKLTVLNSWEGKANTAAKVTIDASGSHLSVVNRLAEGQTVRFAGAQAEFTLPQGGFRYTETSAASGPSNGSFSATGTLEPGTTLIVGIDPRNLSLMPPRLVVRP